MTVHTDELLERKWRELGNVPIDYTPDEPDGVFRDRILVNYERMRLAMERIGLLLEVRLHSKDRDFGEYIYQKVEHDLDILEDQIAVLDTLIDLWQIQEF